VADRGYFSSLEILAYHEAGITVTLPKPLTSGAQSEGRFGKQDLPEEDAYRIEQAPEAAQFSATMAPLAYIKSLSVAQAIKQERPCDLPDAIG
jgi:hypothetical protein